jgi:hypothetical protein
MQPPLPCSPTKAAKTVTHHTVPQSPRVQRTSIMGILCGLTTFTSPASQCWPCMLLEGLTTLVPSQCLPCLLLKGLTTLVPSQCLPCLLLEGLTTLVPCQCLPCLLLKA